MSGFEGNKVLMVSFVRQYVWGLLFLGLLGILWGAPAWAKERSEILIGTHLPLTGRHSGAGLEQEWAYREAVRDINELGGIFVREFGKKLPVRLIIEDDESSSDKAVDAVERLVDLHGVDLVLSGFAGDEGVIPACASAEKRRVYYHASTSWAKPWLKHNFKWSTLFFFDIEQGAEIPFQLWNSMPRGTSPKRPALFYEDAGDGRSLARLFQLVSKRYGYDFVLSEALPLGRMDFSAQIKRSKALGVDAILIFSSEDSCTNFIRQMKKNNLSVSYFHGWKGTWAGSFYRELGSDAEYVLSDGFWSMDFPFPGARRLGERYQQRFNETSVSVGCYYALAQILWQAIEMAGTLDGGKVRNAVLKNRFETVMGPIKYQTDGIATFVVTANQWIDGRQELVYPFKWAKKAVQIPPPWEAR